MSRTGADPGRPLELWGGVECTVARVGDHFRDQSEETGHRDRIDDLDRIAALGIRTLRYPFLWESVSPDEGEAPDFAWLDGRMERLRALGIEPIATLCHHGSGPPATNLLDPAFPEGLAGHAARVAERYPDIRLYTPVNEPLTTARFSALYGHWYPHARETDAFLRALVHESKATVLSMRAIRRRRPDAQLVQTDDLGKTFATPSLARQAEHDNERRWLSFDLLCGRVDRHHPFWPALIGSGVAEADLALLLEGEGAPDIIGINHYLTSDRFLDPRLHRYPEALWGGNGRQRYADVEAVRVDLPARDLGPEARLREAWERYRRPVAVTEVHHGCTREEQLRWFQEVWRAAETLRAEGADIRAVTLWALFGTVDWNSLLTRRDGVYEAGAFDVRGTAPRPTAIARAARSLATEGRFDHPALDRPGWWRRDARYYQRPGSARACPADGARSLVVLNANGRVGRTLRAVAEHRGLDLATTDLGGAADAIAACRAWGVIDAGAADHGPQNPGLAEAVARVAAAAGLPLLAFSSHAAFDGRLGRAYREDDAVATSSPAAEAERRLRAAHPQALVVRTGPLFGPNDGDGVALEWRRRLGRGQAVDVPAGIITPSYLPDAVHVALDLLIDGETGDWHLANPHEGLSWRDFALWLAQDAGLAGRLVREMPVEGAAPVTALASARGALLPPLASAVERFHGDAAILRPLPVAAE